MRTLPHHPPVDAFRALRATLDLALAGDERDHARAAAAEDAAALMTAGENLLVRGFIAGLFDEPAAQVCRYVRRGLALKLEAVEAGRALNAWLMWDYLLFALGANDPGLAHRFAGLPGACWWNRSIRPVSYFVNRSRALVALYRGQSNEARRLLNHYRVQVVEEELPPEAQGDAEDLRNAAVLLEALLDGNARLFANGMARREEWRGAAFSVRGTAAPRALIDMDGLGLCRMALDRGIGATVQHPYLPLELLRVPAEPGT